MRFNNDSIFGLEWYRDFLINFRTRPAFGLVVHPEPGGLVEASGVDRQGEKTWQSGKNSGLMWFY